MENNIAEKLLKDMEKALMRIGEKELSPIERLREVIPVISRSISEIRGQVLKNGFDALQDEVYFFKHVKPRFYAHQIFEVLLYNLHMQTPPGTPEMLKAYFEDELQQVFRLFKIEAFPYQYFKMEATELDHLYFVRNAVSVETQSVELIDPFPGFSTAWDYKFAKFIAFEKLQDLLIECLTGSQPARDKRKPGQNRLILKWTGDTINLVEIAYGIWLTGQINHGNAGIAEIMQFLESSFHVNIGRPFRRWQSISSRKRVSQVKYIDQLKAAILKRVDDENA